MPWLPPVAHNDVYTAVPGMPTVLYVVNWADATDPQNATLTINSVTSPADGTAAITNGTSIYITYTSKPDFTGTDSFQYTVTNGHEVSEPATVTIVVTEDGIGGGLVGIDSDNSGPVGYAGNNRDGADLNTPGTVVPLDTTISDDGVPGFADGYGLYGDSDWLDERTSCQYNLLFPAGSMRSTGRVDIEYSDSDPAAVTRSGSGTTEDPYQYQLPQEGGALRLWTVDSAYDERTSQSISEYDPSNPNDSGLGFYVPAGIYGASVLENMTGYPGNPWLGLCIRARPPVSQCRREHDYRQL